MGALSVDFLRGTWHVERTIEDAQGEPGAFWGTATFTPDGDGLLFREVGTTRFGEIAAPASRQLSYAPRADGSIEVNFSDGHHFIEIVPAPASSDTHHCGADLYEITTTVLAPDLYEERWRVRGPAKDYSATTLYRRAP